MTTEQKLDYMINSLQLAKEEIAYAKKYLEQASKDKDFYQYGHMGYEGRTPNGTIIRESLKMVGRMSNIVASEVILSPYSNVLFKDDIKPR